MNRLKFLATLASGLLAAAPAQAQSLGAAERAVLSGFNICWDAEAGGNLAQLAAAKGFTRMQRARGPLFYRDVGGSVVFVTADFGAGADGRPEPACRITALKPQVNSSYAPRQAILPGAGALRSEIARLATQNMGYRLASQGGGRTLLLADRGPRGKMIYVEETPGYHEYLYVEAARNVINDPRTRQIGLDPAGRAPLQAFVTDRWQIAFCNLNPHACQTPGQARAAAPASVPNTTLPFSGIGGRSGDNRTQQQRNYDSNWWQNHHRCGRGKC